MGYSGLVCPHISGFLFFMTGGIIMNQLEKQILHFQQMLDMLESVSKPDSIVQTIGISRTIQKLQELEEEYQTSTIPM